ncbi:MAG: hypothetical protein KIT14_08515 [bacterium]|nr:hypothetical protein [bacterium]
MTVRVHAGLLKRLQRARNARTPSELIQALLAEAAENARTTRDHLDDVAAPPVRGSARSAT